jgi:hypothetical protein
MLTTNSHHLVAITTSLAAWMAVRLIPCYSYLPLSPRCPRLLRPRNCHVSRPLSRCRLVPVFSPSQFYRQQFRTPPTPPRTPRHSLSLPPPPPRGLQLHYSTMDALTLIRRRTRRRRLKISVNRLSTLRPGTAPAACRCRGASSMCATTIVCSQQPGFRTCEPSWSVFADSSPRSRPMTMRRGRESRLKVEDQRTQRTHVDGIWDAVRSKHLQS